MFIKLLLLALREAGCFAGCSLLGSWQEKHNDPNGSRGPSNGSFATEVPAYSMLIVPFERYTTFP